MLGIGFTLRWTVRGVWCRSVNAHGGMNISGVNTPMIYVGQAMSLFAFHYEDNGLLSISFLDRGANKIWYLSASSSMSHTLLSAVFALAHALHLSIGLPLSQLSCDPALACALQVWCARTPR